MGNKSPVDKARIDATTQYILFTILVVLTPFIVVTKYLQGVVHIVSRFNFTLFDRFEIPLVLSSAIVLLVGFLFYYRKQITLRKVFAGVFCLILIAFSQSLMDIYLEMSFFELQENWHYTTYCAYIFFFFRAHNAYKMRKNRMILLAFSSAVLMSFFDEAFQYYLSNRTFDISDITKDSMGACIGLIIVLFITESYGTIQLKNFRPWQRDPKDYFRKPGNALLMVLLLTIVFTFTSPLLSEPEEAWVLLGISFPAFFLLMTIIHYMRHKAVRIGVLAVLLVAFVSLGASFLVNRDKQMMHYQHGFAVYKGIPLVFFDALIYPDGTFRFVDKKHHFRSQDKRYLQEQKPDIILIGSGSRNRGGKGFTTGVGTHFLFNRYTMRGNQVIIEPSPVAIKTFNRLKAQGKNVLFVLHMTC